MRSQPDARAYLFSLALHGVKLGLENITTLLSAAGHPERRYPTVHVAGTNGKGSTLAMLQAMLVAAGYRVGRFTSPHLLDVRERFQINGQNITEEALLENIDFFRAAAATASLTPTFFELNTAVAFRWFEQTGVDVALVEVGMGGRLDSTNTIVPEVTAITNIALEHQQYLGDTLAKIAFEKAGILKPNVPVVVGERQAEPLQVILGRARELRCPVRLLGRDFSFDLRGDPWSQVLHFDSVGLTLDAPLALAGRFQGENAAVAVALALELQQRFPKLSPMAIREGLASASWPCRLERILDTPPVIIDVAHNHSGAERLCEVIGKYVIVFAVSSDKDVAAMLSCLAPHAAPLILTQFSSDRSLPLERLEAAAASYAHHTASDLVDAIALGLQYASADVPLLITGSIYAAGEARRILMERYGAKPPAF